MIIHSYHAESKPIIDLHTTTAPNLTRNERLKMVGLAFDVARAVSD